MKRMTWPPLLSAARSSLTDHVSAGKCGGKIHLKAGDSVEIVTDYSYKGDETKVCSSGEWRGLCYSRTELPREGSGYSPYVARGRSPYVTRDHSPYVTRGYSPYVTRGRSPYVTRGHFESPPCGSLHARTRSWPSPSSQAQQFSLLTARPLGL